MESLLRKVLVKTLHFGFICNVLSLGKTTEGNFDNVQWMTKPCIKYTNEKANTRFYYTANNKIVFGPSDIETFNCNGV